jgi:hypothetical protein
VDPRAGLDDVEKRKFLPHRDSNADPSVVEPVASRFTDCDIPASWNSAKLIKHRDNFTFINRRHVQWDRQNCLRIDLEYAEDSYFCQPDT